MKSGPDRFARAVRTHSPGMSDAELPIETFLKAQPRTVLNRLYEKPASCLAVFR